MICPLVFIHAQTYQYKLDLNQSNEDKVKVELQCPAITTNTIQFHFPMTVPGTYAVLDYGRYIENLVAKDKDGKVLIVKKKGNNDFEIANANQLSTLSYWVNDSWDADTKKNKVFEPAGTNIQKDKNFVLNAGGWFGFF